MIYSQTQRFILTLIGITAAIGLIFWMASNGGNNTNELQIERHLDMCDGIEDEQLRIECYEGVPSEHELING